MRSDLHQLLADVVSARIHIDALASSILTEYRSGHRPTYRGYEWGPDQIALLDQVRIAIDTSFHLLKALQFPETTTSRLLAVTALPSLPPPDDTHIRHT